MQKKCIKEELGSNSYPGRGIIIGKSEDGTKAVTAYFIMGRSSNSRNRVFVEDGEGAYWAIRPSLPTAIRPIRSTMAWITR